MKHIIVLETEDGSQAGSAVELLRAVTFVKSAEIHSAFHAPKLWDLNDADHEVLDWFASRMAGKLQHHAEDPDRPTHTPLGWRDYDVKQVFGYLLDEVRELYEAINEAGGLTSLIAECADVANRAMQIADLAFAVYRKD